MQSREQKFECSVAKRYARLAADYDTRWERYVTESHQHTLSYINLKPHLRVLDVGCGTGVLLQHLLEGEPTLELAGIDLSGSMLKAAHDRFGRRHPVIHGSVDALPVADASFDRVVNCSSLHYWPDPYRGVAEKARVLRPGGQLVLTDWCRDAWRMRVLDRCLRIRGGGYRQTYTMGACKDFLVNSGLHVATLEQYPVSNGWNLMTAVAFRPDD